MTSIDLPTELANGRRTPRDSNGWELGSLFEIGISSLGSVPSSPWNMQVPLLAWLIATFQPRVVVDLDLCGSQQGDTLSAMGDIAERLGTNTRCVSVSVFAESQEVAQNWSSDHRKSSDVEIVNAKTVNVAEQTVRKNAPPDEIDLLHVRLPSVPGDYFHRVDAWIQRLRPGAVIVLSGQEDRCEQSDVWKEINERFPLVPLEGVSSSLAQVPVGDDVPLIEALSARPASRLELSLLAERGEYRYLMGPDPHSPLQLRRAIDQMMLERESELGAAREGLAALRREVERALSLSASAESTLAAERERHGEELAAERERVLALSRDEMDTLAAKVAISAARYERKLVEVKGDAEQQRQDLEHRLLEAHYEIQQLRSSTSWRMTAGLRWAIGVLRRLARRA